MSLLILLSGLSFNSASAADWQEKSFTTAEGDTLVAKKKGRAKYSMSIASADKKEAINCSWGFYGYVSRTVFALSMKTAGAQAGLGQVGSVASYSDAYRKLISDKAAAEMAMFGAPICAVGIDTFPDMVVLTLGSVYKNAGRTATLNAEQTGLLSAWLMAE